MSILSNSAEFSPVGPDFQHKIFCCHDGSYLLGAVASIKLLAIENALNYGTVVYCRLGNERAGRLMAILPDNCHPSSFGM